MMIEQLKQAPLTAREMEVVKLLVQGKRVKEVAPTLGMSTTTAETHVCNIHSKLAIHNRAGLVRWAIQTGVGIS